MYEKRARPNKCPRPLLPRTVHPRQCAVHPHFTALQLIYPCQRHHLNRNKKVKKRGKNGKKSVKKFDEEIFKFSSGERECLLYLGIGGHWAGVVELEARCISGPARQHAVLLEGEHQSSKGLIGDGR